MGSLEDAEEETEETELTTVLSLESDEVTSVSFIADDTEVTFEKSDDSWIKTDEEEFPLDQTVIDSAVQAITDLDASVVIEDAEDLSAYNLDDPDNIIVVNTENTENTITVGLENESTGQYYILLDDDEATVYVVDSDDVSPFMNSLYDYAESGSFPSIDSSTVTNLMVESENSWYTLSVSDSDSLWYVSGDYGENEKADSSSASTIISSASALSYSSFVDYDADDLSVYGLENPYATITIDYTEEVEVEDEAASSDDADATSTDADSTSVDAQDSEDEVETVTVDRELTVYIGDETEDGTRYVTTDNIEVYTVSTDTLSEILDLSEANLWDLTVNYLYIDNLSRLDVSYQNHENSVTIFQVTTTATANDADSEEEVTTYYKLNGQSLGESRITDFTTFYNKLVNMTGESRLTEDYSPEVDPEMTVTFTDTDEEITVVEFYSYDSSFYAAVINDKVYLVNKITVEDMFDSYVDFLTVSYEDEATSEDAAVTDSDQ